MQYFLSCDWGTSVLRIRLADAHTGAIQAEVSSQQGIAATYRQWQDNGADENARIAFFLNVVKSHILKLEERAEQSLKNYKLVISGMASASIGLKELPYTPLPLPIDGSGLDTLIINEQDNFPHEICLIPGLKSDCDVMRGEETQLIGCAELSDQIKNQLFIFPGTHSKHIRVEDNCITGFKTYMTGEFFELLSKKSILANDIDSDRDIAFMPDSFGNGLAESAKSNLLHSAFTTRVNRLSGFYDKAAAFFYLSGLVIGSEINELKDANMDRINLVCNKKLWNLYRFALNALLPERNINIFPPDFADQATVNGQLKIARSINFIP